MLSIDRRATDVAWRPILLADWVEAAFVHYAVPPRRLARHVPFTLDTWDGDAYVSLVAFTQRNLRPAVGGRLAALLAAPVARHEFLNVRTYVRDEQTGERGIHFLAEWIPNRLAALIGPVTYGLPYRVGRLTYRHDPSAGTFEADVRAPGGELRFDGSVEGTPFQPAATESLDAFLVERYTAWTSRRGVARRFRIRHAPWPQARACVTVRRCDLLEGLCGGLLTRLEPRHAHVSPGVFGVEMGPPQRVRTGATAPT